MHHVTQPMTGDYLALDDKGHTYRCFGQGSARTWRDTSTGKSYTWDHIAPVHLSRVMVPSAP